MDRPRLPTEYARNRFHPDEAPLTADPKQPEPGPRVTRVLLISDGRPGHFRQSEGVVAALRRQGPVDVQRIELRNRFPMPKALIPKLGRVLPAGWALSLLHGLDARAFTKPDLIVSSGGSTLGANVALAASLKAPNIFSGSTRGYSLDAFRLVLTPYASVGQPPKVLAGPKPTPFDPDRVPPPRQLRSLEDMRGARVCMLIGGPTPYADFGDDDWARLASLLEGLVTEWACRLTIVTSPRTPDAAYARILPLAERNDGHKATIVDFRKAGPGSIDAAFDADLVMITSDSMSMTTEAALSRRPAISIAPARVKPNKDDEAMAGLVEAGWLKILPLEKTNAAALAGAAVAITPIAYNHLDRLGDIVREAICERA